MLKYDRQSVSAPHTPYISSMSKQISSMKMFCLHLFNAPQTKFPTHLKPARFSLSSTHLSGNQDAHTEAKVEDLASLRVSASRPTPSPTILQTSVMLDGPHARSSFIWL